MDGSGVRGSEWGGGGGGGSTSSPSQEYSLEVHGEEGLGVLRLEEVTAAEPLAALRHELEEPLQVRRRLVLRAGA